MKTDRHNFQIIANTMFRLLPVQIILAGLSSVNATVSGLFASNLIGADAMSAVALYDPIAKLLTAIATMLTGGAAILCGKYMGRNERDKMQGIFSLDMTLAAVISALIAVFLFIMGSFGLTGALTKDPVVAPHLHQYLIGQAAGVIPLLLGIQLSTFLSLENRMRRTVTASIVFIIMNIVFNYVLIKMMGLGTLGLSLASSLGQWVFFLVQLQFFFSKEATLHFSAGNIAFSETAEIVKIGIPGALSLGYQAIRSIVCNNIVTGTVGSVGLSAYGTCNSLLGLVWAIPFGMVAVSRMLISVSVGEEDRETMVDIMKVMMRRYVPLQGIVSLAIILAAVPLTNLFYHDPAEAVYMMTVWGFRILPLSMPLSIICMHFVCYGTAMNKQVYIHTLSLLDGVVSVVLFTALLINTMGINALYVANVLNGVVTTLYIVGYAWYKNRNTSLRMRDLMVIPESFGVGPDESMDISVNSMGDVIKVAESVQAFCRARGMDEKTSYHAALAMEEMAGNIVDHGFTKDNKEHSIDIRVVHKEDDIILRMRDNCIPFNPGERLKLTDSENPVSNIGIRTIFAMARDVSYQSIRGMNVLTIKV